MLDLDQDGHSDLVMGPLEVFGTRHAIYLRKPSSAGGGLLVSDYEAPVVQVMPMGYPSDVDGDGDKDLLGERVVRNVHLHGPSAGSRLQYGEATAGEAGVRPLLGATGPFRVGSIKRLQVRGVTGPTPGLLVIGFRPANLVGFPLPSVTMLVDPGFVITASVAVLQPGEGRGAGGVDHFVPLPPLSQGLVFYDQFFLLDPAAPDGVAATNGLRIQVGG